MLVWMRGEFNAGAFVGNKLLLLARPILTLGFLSSGRLIVLSLGLELSGKLVVE